jgi:hypothetical protein
MLALCSLLLAGPPAYPWPHAAEAETVAGRFAPPEGFVRLPMAEGSFGAWLRDLPLRPGCPEVKLFDGRRKRNQTAQVAVVDIDVGTRDLQQCADAVMRLRAEYLRSRARDADICFRFTSGTPHPWSRWAKGERPKVRGSEVRFTASAKADDSYASFRAYLDSVFLWAGSASLALELAPVEAVGTVQPGDVLIQGGYPGHAVLVADVAENAAGERVMLLLQSYTPAQELHLLARADAPGNPWYPAQGEGPIETPEWTFARTDLRRFQERGCP